MIMNSNNGKSYVMKSTGSIAIRYEITRMIEMLLEKLPSILSTERPSNAQRIDASAFEVDQSSTVHGQRTLAPCSQLINCSESHSRATLMATGDC